jgi:hypothetical protein
LIVALFTVMESAWAQVMPFRGTLTYVPSRTEDETLVVKAANGSAAYVLKLLPMRGVKGNIVGIDLVMRRPNAAVDARNLLEPEGRWHGLQDYNFNAIDFVNGPERSTMGPTRTIKIKSRKLSVSFTISKTEIASLTDNSSSPIDYAFKELIVDVAVDNLK